MALGDGPGRGVRTDRPCRARAFQLGGEGGDMAALTVILPCYNEARRLPATLQAFLAHLSSVPGEVEILVVDDGSTDATVAAAEAAAGGDPRVRVIRTGPNRGKGFAVRVGMLAAAGDRVVFTDADGSYGPDEVDRVARALAGAPVAIGTRDPAEAGERLARRVASGVFNGAVRALLGLPFGDTQCGLKGFRRDAARAVFGRARLDGFAFDAEALVLARRLGLAVAEVPVRAQERAGSKVRVLADGPRMLAELWAVRRAVGSAAADGVAARPAPGWPAPPARQGWSGRARLEEDAAQAPRPGAAAWGAARTTATSSRMGSSPSCSPTLRGPRPYGSGTGR
jgi:hypothetical protein